MADLPVGARRCEAAQSGTAERATIDFVEAVVLSGRVGQVLEAEVVDADRDAFRVQLRDPAVVALRPGQQPSLERRSSVRVARVEPDARRVELELVS